MVLLSTASLFKSAAALTVASGSFFLLQASNALASASPAKNIQSELWNWCTSLDALTSTGQPITSLQQQDKIRELLSQGADPSLLHPKSGASAFHRAVLENCKPCVQTLLASGKCDVNGAEKGAGATAMHLAAYNGDVDMIQILTKAGASTNLIKDKQKMTAEELARHLKNFEAASVMAEARGIEKPYVRYLLVCDKEREGQLVDCAGRVMCPTAWKSFVEECMLSSEGEGKESNKCVAAMTQANECFDKFGFKFAGSLREAQTAVKQQ